MKTQVYKLVLGVVITLISLSTTAQDYEYIPLVKSGLQIWTTESSGQGFGWHYNRFALTEEDTLMDDGKIYKKIYLFLDSVFIHSTSECIGGIREENKKVFFKGKNSYDGEPLISGLICDFSLSIGDTCKFAPYDDGPFIIVDIDTVNISGIPRKRFHLGFINPNYTICKWIEGIGSDLGLLFVTHQRLITKSYANGSLLCYLNNGDLQYSNSGDKGCFPIVSIDDISLDDNSITLYPNPSNSEVNISSENIINSIEIFNSLGQRVYQSVVNSNTKTIDISSFTNGVYILGVNTENGVIRKKIIKN